MINPKPKPQKREKKGKVKKKVDLPAKRKYRKKSEFQKLEIEADRIIRQIVLLRDYGLCCCPEPEGGHSGVLQAGHLITRGKKSVRWDLWNVNVQCSSCNMLHEHYAERYTSWFILEFGSKRYMDLVERSAIVRKIPEIEMRQLCAGLNSLLVSLQIEELNPDEYRLTQEEIINIGKIVIPDK